MCNLPSQEERENRSIGLFNTSTTFDLELMEGLKIMMLLTLVELKQQISDGENVPLFGHLLFARDSSETVSAFLKNHLDCVGDTGGLEQVGSLMNVSVPCHTFVLISSSVCVKPSHSANSLQTFIPAVTGESLVLESITLEKPTCISFKK